MTHTVSVSLRWSDTDSQGHVNHAVLLTLLEEGRSRWITEAASSLANNIVAARIEIDYLAPMLYSEKQVEVTTTVDRIGNKSFTLTQTISSTRSEGLRFAQASVVIVAFTPETQGSRTLSDTERRWLGNHVHQAAVENLLH